jgi:hypothetical protein
LRILAAAGGAGAGAAGAARAAAAAAGTAATGAASPEAIVYHDIVSPSLRSIHPQIHEVDHLEGLGLESPELISQIAE